MIGYKGFDKNLKCRGFQYKIGKTYKEKEAICCNKGFHFCKYPLDVLNYYAPVDSKGNYQRYCKIESLGDIDYEKDSTDTKVCTNKIKIGAEVTLEQLTKASINFIYEHTKKDNKKSAHKEEPNSVASNTGDSSVASNTGYSSVASNTGDRSVASNTGYRSVASNTGYSSVASNTGDSSVASNTGYSSVASNTGYSSVASNTGYSSVASNTGDRSVASNTGDRGIASSLGVNSKAKAKKGNWIVLAEWTFNESTFNWEVKEVKTALIDGKQLKEDTLYQLIDGNFVDVEED